METNETAAPTETYQKNQLLWPMLLSHWMTSGAVPPNRSTVRCTRYRCPGSVARSETARLLRLPLPATMFREYASYRQLIQQIVH